MLFYANFYPDFYMNKSLTFKQMSQQLGVNYLNERPSSQQLEVNYLNETFQTKT